MKLQKLIINNIASITDATINFEEEPLKSSSIFLITGPTGSGKTTILDAICLALFNKTPRLDSVAAEKFVDGNTYSNNDEASINDPRVLMRLGCTECSVKLYFSDDSDNEYMATWSVGRANHRIDGNIKNVEWKLWKADGSLITQKTTDTRGEIQRILGVSYSNFIRTVMLSQGEFSKFLKSKASEKSSILENLTGTDIYKQVGKSIANHYKKEKGKLDKLEAKINGISLLDEEQKQECLTVIAQKEKAINELKAQQDTLLAIDKWKDDFDKATNDIKTATTDLKVLQDKFDSDEYQNKDTLVKEYDSTTEIRSKYQKYEAYVKTEREQAAKLSDELSNTIYEGSQFDNAINPIKEIDSIIDNLNQQISKKNCERESLKPTELAKDLASCQTKKANLENAKTLFGNIISAKKKEADAKTQLDEQKRKKSDLESKTSAFQEKAENARTEFTSKENEYNEAKDSCANWAKEARRKLKVGDSCPVCGAKIDSVLSDESFISVLKPIEESLKKLRQAKEDAEGALSKHKGLINGIDISTFEKNLETAKCAVTEAKTNFSQNPVYNELKDAKDIVAKADEMKNEIEQQASRIKADLNKAEDLLEEITPLQEQKDAILESRTRIRGIINSRDEAHESAQRCLESINQYLQGDGTMTLDRIKELCNTPASDISMARQAISTINNQINSFKTTIANAQKSLHELEKPEIPDSLDLAELKVKIEEVKNDIIRASEEKGAKENELETDKKNHEKLASEIKEKEKQETITQKWERLYKMFGVSSGDTFRNIAQSFVLQELLINANEYLIQFTDRYEMTCSPGSLTILAIDKYQGGKRRPVSNISGGESFLFSLSLALGLSSLSKNSLSIDTLFIDEGFGTLSEDYLQTVMYALERLHDLNGRRVGIISHVEGLRQIPTRIELSTTPGNNSTIKVVSD